MNTTTNFSLKTYQSSDLFNPLTVENVNMETIDTDMKAIDDKTIGRATELVSQGVHAITLLDTDAKVFKFVATANYTTGETFTVNGIQANAYTPSGSALTTNAYVTGSIVIGSLNADNTAITFYLSGSATADNALKLGGELPAYYAKQTDLSNAETDITNLKNLTGNTSIVGIGDGTMTGGISSLNEALSGVKFRINNGLPEISVDNGVTWTPIIDNLLSQDIYTLVGTNELTITPPSGATYIQIRYIDKSQYITPYVIINNVQSALTPTYATYPISGNFTIKSVDQYSNNSCGYDIKYYRNQP